MPLAGRQLTIDEALALCYSVGFRSGNLVTAVAVMTAESGRYTEAWHANANGSTDRGLFQINTIHTVPGDAYDPVDNAKYAWQLSQHGKNWTPWAAYNSGAYTQFIADIRERKLFHPWRWRKLVESWQ